MYQIEGTAQVIGSHRRGLRPARPWVNRTVLALGLTSLFTDVSSEMITAVLPIYLVFGLHVSPLVFGVVDGLYAAATAPARLIGGFWADRARRHKELAVVGYGLSTGTRLGMLLVGNAWAALLGLLLVDRVGKGIRTAPRDAMISLATPRDRWGVAFGTHRALDMAGAMAGPVLAFAVLAAAPRSYDAVFVVSLCAAVIGLGVLVLFVPHPRRPAVPTTAAVTVRAAAGLIRKRAFASVLATATVLGLATLGDAFLYLTLQDRLGFDIGLFPLLYVATSLVFMVLAVPVGGLADRVGRARVFAGGYVALLGVYALLVIPGGAMSVVGAVLLLGAFYAATDGVLMALASESLPPHLRTSGMALVATAVSLARFGSSVLFGLLWTTVGVHTAVLGFACGLAGALTVAVVLVGRRRLEPAR